MIYPRVVTICIEMSILIQSAKELILVALHISSPYFFLQIAVDMLSKKHSHTDPSAACRILVVFCKVSLPDYDVD